MHISSYSPFGIEGMIVRVEVDIRRGIPGVDISGLADGAVRESRERIRAAFRNSGFSFPQDRVLVNLAPAGVRKEGAAFDLPIAVAILAASAQAPLRAECLALGELELSGRVRPVRGVLAAVSASKDAGIESFIVPEENGAEADILAEGRSAAVSSLSEAVAALRVLDATGRFPERTGPSPDPSDRRFRYGDFSDARGLGRYKRALEIAAAGGHHLLAFGVPGAGKTMLARRLPGILAPLTAEESVETTRLHSLAGALGSAAPLVSTPPFRAPHHSASAEGILGGGRGLRPGEISLAHNGVLFLDEAPEFRSNVLHSLREPVEDGGITLSRAGGKATLPADFQLLLTANPCPCGRLGKTNSTCFCSSEEVARHWRRMGAALLDRVDLRVPLAPESVRGRGIGAQEERSEAISARVRAAVEMQRERLEPFGIRRNGRIGPAQPDRLLGLDAPSKAVLAAAADKLGFSGRARASVLRVARTVADLEGSIAVRREHVLEAIQHRRYGDDPFDVLAAAEL